MTTSTPVIQLAPPPAHANRFLSRLLGMFSPVAKRRGAVVIYPCSSIHTFFMNRPLRIVFLDSSRKVLACHDSVAPFKTLACPGSYYVFETGAGVLNQKLEVGDVVDF